jgi:hypothetical protein
MSTETAGTLVRMPEGDSFTEIAALVERLKIETQIPDDEFRADIAAIMENILRADSEEEVFARQEAGGVASKDYVNRPFTLSVEGIQWKLTGHAFREGGSFPFYAMLKVVDSETGNDMLINAGGATVVAVLDKLARLGALDEPRSLMFVEKPVASGFSVILLRPIKTAAAPSPRAKK